MTAFKMYLLAIVVSFISIILEPEIVSSFEGFFSLIGFTWIMIMLMFMLINRVNQAVEGK